MPPGQADAASQDSQEPVAAEPDTDTGNRLALAFSADCWVQVTGVDGQSLHSGLMRAGQSLELTHEAGMALVLGAAEAVSSARFNGETIQLSTNGQPSGVVRIRLGE